MGNLIELELSEKINDNENIILINSDVVLKFNEISS